MAKKDNIDITQETLDLTEQETVLVKDRGRFMTAIEYAITFDYNTAIASAVKTLDPNYKFNQYESDWENIFKAFMDKPVNVDWKDYYKV